MTYADRSAVDELVIATLAESEAELRARVRGLESTQRELIDLLADVTYRNFLLSFVADYRCRANPDLLDLLAGTAARATRRAAA